MSMQAIAVKALSSALGVRVSTQMPETKPNEFVIISRIGGGADDWATRNPRFLVECYASSELAAENLGEKVWEAWRSLRTPEITWASVDNNLTRFDDPDPKLHRFQFTGGLQFQAPR